MSIYSVQELQEPVLSYLDLQLGGRAIISRSVSARGKTCCIHVVTSLNALCPYLFLFCEILCAIQWVSCVSVGSGRGVRAISNREFAV